MGTHESGAERNAVYARGRVNEAETAGRSVPTSLIDRAVTRLRRLIPRASQRDTAGGEARQEPLRKVADHADMIRRADPVRARVLASLSYREWTVLRLIGAGRANAEISMISGYSEFAVRVHEVTLTQALGFSNRDEVERWFDALDPKGDADGCVEVD